MCLLVAQKMKVAIEKKVGINAIASLIKEAWAIIVKSFKKGKILMDDSDNESDAENSSDFYDKEAM